MRSLLAILFSLSGIFSLYGQSGPANVIPSTPNATIADTLKLPGQSTVDSLKAAANIRMDSLKRIQQAISVANKADSLNELLNSPANKIKDRISSVNAKKDSLGGLPGGVFDRIQNKISHSTDSVGGGAAGGVSKVSDSANALQDKIGTAEGKVNGVIDGSASKVENAIEGATGKSIALDKKLSLDAKLPGTTLPDIDGKLPVPGINTKDINLNIPDAGGVEIPQGGLNELTNDVKLPEAGSMPDVGDVAGQAGDVGESLGELNKYELELKKAQEGGIPNVDDLAGTAEEKAGELTGMDGMNADMTKFTGQKGQYDAMIAKYSDKKALQQEITRKAANVANDMAAKYAPAFQKAQADLTRSKQSVNKIKSVKDLFKKKSTVLEGKKFHERLIPAITLQVYSRDVVAVDFAAQLGYRVTPSLSGGLGALYRTGFSDKYQYFVSGQGVYGGRVYAELIAVKGVFLHGEFEALKVDRDKFPQTNDVLRDKVYGSYFGLGKKFNVSRAFKASMMGLYRIEYTGTLPAMNKISMRLGIEYTWKKKKKFEGLRKMTDSRKTL